MLCTAAANAGRRWAIQPEVRLCRYAPDVHTGRTQGCRIGQVGSRRGCSACREPTRITLPRKSPTPRFADRHRRMIHHYACGRCMDAVEHEGSQAAIARFVRASLILAIQPNRPQPKPRSRESESRFWRRSSVTGTLMPVRWASGHS